MVIQLVRNEKKKKKSYIPGMSFLTNEEEEVSDVRH